MPGPIDEAALTRHIVDTLGGVDVVNDGDNLFFFFDPGRTLPVDRRFPFATLVVSDAYDEASNLNRDGVYRLNLGVSRETCQDLFGSSTPADSLGADYDFTALDTIMPHPVYGAMHWICVLNPSAETFERIKPLLVEAHERAATRYERSHSGETEGEETW
jgi:hypothetical protein